MFQHCQQGCKCSSTQLHELPPLLLADLLQRYLDAPARQQLFCTCKRLATALLQHSPCIQLQLPLPGSTTMPPFLKTSMQTRSSCLQLVLMVPPPHAYRLASSALACSNLSHTLGCCASVQHLTLVCGSTSLISPSRAAAVADIQYQRPGRKAPCLPPWTPACSKTLVTAFPHLAHLALEACSVSADALASLVAHPRLTGELQQLDLSGALLVLPPQLLQPQAQPQPQPQPRSQQPLPPPQARQNTCHQRCKEAQTHRSQAEAQTQQHASQGRPASETEAGSKLYIDGALEPAPHTHSASVLHSSAPPPPASPTPPTLPAAGQAAAASSSPFQGSRLQQLSLCCPPGLPSSLLAPLSPHLTHLSLTLLHDPADNSLHPDVLPGLTSLTHLSCLALRWGRRSAQLWVDVPAVLHALPSLHCLTLPQSVGACSEQLAQWKQGQVGAVEE
ncbi:hypothetical protein QJQ45_003622 [Haematococcus lacustris]|nr:hypothetical protein QJQ45_003622 [Haematococcus lacustris]